MEEVHQYSKAGVMIRESLAGNAANAGAFAVAGTGLLSFQGRSSAGDATVRTSPAAGTGLVQIGTPWQFDHGTLVRRRDDLVDHRIGDGGPVSVRLRGPRGDQRRRERGRRGGRQQRGLDQREPAAQRRADRPRDWRDLYRAGHMTVSADASDTDGTIARVDFYQGATLIGSDTSSPYSLTWSNVTAASSSLTAVATDDDSATTTSVARTITVTAPANQPPSVALTAPATGATFTAPANITVSANASDTDGTIARVDFYQGSTLIGFRHHTPYSISWNNVGVGAYSLTAEPWTMSVARRHRQLERFPSPARSPSRWTRLHGVAAHNTTADVVPA